MTTDANTRPTHLDRDTAAEMQRQETFKAMHLARAETCDVQKKLAFVRFLAANALPLATTCDAEGKLVYPADLPADVKAALVAADEQKDGAS